MKQLLIGYALICGLLAAGCRPTSAPPSSEGMRIVSLAPSITESLCAIGAGHLLVGRTSACNYPPEIIDRVPIIGGFGHPSLELLAEARPTLVLDVDLADESVAAQITAMGINRRRLPCDALDDIVPMLHELGALTGHETQAAELEKTLTATIAEARAQQSPNDRHPTVYAEVWHDPLTTVGRNTFLANLIALAGGRTIAESVSKAYFQIAPEQVVSENPDVILCLYMGSSEGAAEAVKRRPGWEHTSAVRNDCVFENLNNDVLLRPGPRLLEGLQAMRGCMARAANRREP